MDVVDHNEANMAFCGNFTWRITEFSVRQSEIAIHSCVFTVGGCNWEIMVYPKGRNVVDCLSLYLVVADEVGLPSGWCVDANFNFTIVNHLQSSDSIAYESYQRHEFKEQATTWGWPSFKSITGFLDSSKGYLLNDTLVVEAWVEVLNVSPPTLVLETSLSNLGKFITGQNIPSSNVGLKSEVPSLKEVKMAKQSLKECLCDLFKLNIKDRLSTSLETLCRAEVGLSSEEQSAVELFWGDFDDFVADFLTFEHENSEFELNKLTRDQMFNSIKNYHDTLISNKKQLDDLNKEEEKFRKRIEKANMRMEAVKSKKTKLISDWEALMVESEETKSKYRAQEKKLEEAHERKRIAEERMSRCTTAWSSLKTHFAN